MAIAEKIKNYHGMPPEFFPKIGRLRFAGAYLIIFFYSFYAWIANYGYPDIFLTQNKLSPTGKYIENTIHNFAIGIDIFYLISGFLICYLLILEKEKTGKINLTKFYLRRILRIFPLYFFIIITGPILSHLFKEPVPSYKYFFAFLGNFEIIKHGLSSAATNHLWTICIVVHFYIIISLLIMFLPLKRLPAFLALIIFISIIYRGMISGTENYWMNMYMNTLSRMDVAAIGALGGYYYYFKKIRFADTYNLKYLLYLIFIYVYLNSDIMDWDNFFSATTKKYFFILIMAYAMGNYALSLRAINPNLKSNFLDFLGKISFSAYIISPLVILSLIKTFNHYSFHNLPLYIILMHILILGLSVLSYKFIELPFLRLKEKFTIGSVKKETLVDFPGFR
jgi:peptidoglycan/LPS O-acetylase OafA/YrhL